MSQQVKEFIRRSGVNVQTSDSNSNNDNNLATELENILYAQEEKRNVAARPGAQFFREPKRDFPVRLQKNLVSNRTYGMFKQFENNSNDNLNNEFKNIVPIAPPRELVISKLNPAMYNALVNEEFGAKETRIDLKKILARPLLPKTLIGEGLYVDTLEMRGIYGQFKTGFTRSKNYENAGNINRDFSSVQIVCMVSRGDEAKKATFNFFKNGKIRFSAGFIGADISNQPELIRRFIVNSYTQREPFLYNPFKYNNLSATFQINGIFKNLERMGQTSRKYGMTYVTYEPELTPFLYAYFGEHKLIISKSGSVQISGAKDPAALLQAYNIGEAYVKALHSNGEIEIKGMPPAKVVRTKVDKKSRITKNRAKLMNFNMVKCMRLSKPELLDIAKKVGVPGVKNTDRKGALCKKIIMKTGSNKPITFKNTNKGINVSLTNTGPNFKIGKIKCANMSRTELDRIAAILNIPIDASDTKTTLCTKIEKVRNSLKKVRNEPVPSPPKVVAPAPKKIKVAPAPNTVTMKRRRLNDESIKQDLIKLYGSTWMKRYGNGFLNSDVQKVKQEIAKMSKLNKKGLPFKGNVDILKKNMVSNWKLMRKMNYEKKYLQNKVEVTGIPLNMRNSFRRAAVDFIMNKNGKVSKKQMNTFRQNWLKFMESI